MSGVEVYTYGYGGSTLLDLVGYRYALGAVVADVRLVPFSKQREWTRDSLQGLFDTHYRWVSGFGNRNYRGGPIRLRDPERGLQMVAAIMEQGYPVILLCGCGDVNRCHRRVVASFLEERLVTSTIHLPSHLDDWATRT